MPPIEMRNEGSEGTVGTADQTYYLDDQGNVTTDEEKAATVLINKGQDIPKEMADKYDIGKVAQPEDEEEAKASKSSSSKANKAKKPAENK